MNIDRRKGQRRTLDRPHDEERRSCPDRRHDLLSRERVESLESRYRRVSTLCFASLAVTLLVTTLGFVIVGNQNDDLTNEVHDRQADTKARINESCTIAERKQKKDVDDLKATYAYLLKLPPDQRRKGINGAILAQLPKSEAAAREDDAPSYCDEPNVGLPEPDTLVPDRPLELGGTPPSAAALAHP